MPTTRSTPPSRLPSGVPYGPGKLSVPELNAERMTARYELGDRQADRAWNGDGLTLSAEAKLRNGQREALESVNLYAGVEGLEARFRVVDNGRGELDFRGLRLRDGYFKGKLEEGRDWLAERPVAAGAAVAGAIALTHVVAQHEGPIEVDTGKIKLYQENGLTASVTGVVQFTGDSRVVRPHGAKAKLEYQTPDFGKLSLEAEIEKGRGTRAEARWEKQYSPDLHVNARVYHDAGTNDTGAFVGLSYRW